MSWFPFVTRTGHIKILLLGSPCVGKTTLFDIWTKNPEPDNDPFLFSTTDINVRSVVPEDAELDWMYKSFNCSSKTPIKVTVIDTPSLFTGSKYKNTGLITKNSFLDRVKNCDVIYIVLRGFRNENVSNYYEKIDIVQELHLVEQELMLHDLKFCEDAIRKMERMVRYKQDGREMRFEYDALNKVWGILAGFERPGYIAAGAKQSDIDKIVETLGDEGATLPTRCKGVPLRFANVFEMFDAHDMELLCKHQFYTAKETVYVVNVSARDYFRNNSADVAVLKEYLTTHHGQENRCGGPDGNANGINSNANEDTDTVHTSLTTRSGNSRKSVGYYDSSLVIPVSVEFEFELNHRIYQSEGPEAVLEYLHANPSHISMSNRLLTSVPKAALGYITFYTLEITDPDAEADCDGTVQTGLTSAGFNSVYGNIRAYNIKENTFATGAASVVNVDMERGFICVQVAAYDEIVSYHGDLNLLKRDRKIRQQGRKYIVNDGDVLSFEYHTPQQLMQQGMGVKTLTSATD